MTEKGTPLLSMCKYIFMFCVFFACVGSCDQIYDRSHVLRFEVMPMPRSFVHRCVTTATGPLSNERFQHIRVAAGLSLK